MASRRRAPGRAAAVGGRREGLGRIWRPAAGRAARTAPGLAQNARVQSPRTWTGCETSPGQNPVTRHSRRVNATRAVGARAAEHALSAAFATSATAPPPQRRTGAMASTWRVFTCVLCGNRGFCRAMRRRSPHRTPAARGAGIRGVLARSPDCRAKVHGNRLSWSGSVFGWHIAPATACVQRWPLAMQVAAVPGGFSQPGRFSLDACRGGPCREWRRVPARLPQGMQ